MKIKIKGDGVSLRTDNPELAMLVLKEIGYNSVVEKLATKINANFTEPEFTYRKETQREVEEPTNNIIATEEERTEKKAPRTAKGWTIEEDKLIADNLHKKPKVVCKIPALRKNHSSMGIRSRLSLWKNKKYERVSKDRAIIMQAYLSGERVETVVKSKSMANGSFAWDETGEQILIDKPKSKSMANGSFAWDETEEQILIDNPNAPIKKLMSILPNRTRDAIICKRKALIISGKSKVGRTRKMFWTKEETDVLTANLGKKVKELIRIPILRDKTGKQIENKIQYIKNKK